LLTADSQLLTPVFPKTYWHRLLLLRASCLPSARYWRGGGLRRLGGDFEILGHTISCIFSDILAKLVSCLFSGAYWLEANLSFCHPLFSITYWEQSAFLTSFCVRRPLFDFCQETWDRPYSVPTRLYPPRCPRRAPEQRPRCALPERILALARGSPCGNSRPWRLS